jgi:hypothetical protein
VGVEEHQLPFGEPGEVGVGAVDLHPRGTKGPHPHREAIGVELDLGVPGAPRIGLRLDDLLEDHRRHLGVGLVVEHPVDAVIAVDPLPLV